MRVNTIVLYNNTYSSAPNRANIKEVNLHNVNWVNNSMSNSFYNCYNLITITGINENITNMSYAFYNCQLLSDSLSIPNNLINMKSTFGSCSNLVNSPNIPNSVTDMSYTFSGCSNLKNISNISNSVTNMTNTFYWCTNLVNAPEIPNSVTNMHGTFSGCTNLIDAPIIPSNVTNMEFTFYDCVKLNNAPVIPDGVTNMHGTFQYCSNLVNAPVIPNSVTSIGSAFENCINLINPPVINDCNTLYLYNSFTNCQKMIDIPDMSNVKNIYYMNYAFWNCINLTDINLNCPQISQMTETFSGCVNLNNVNINSDYIINMYYTFHNCTNLNNVNIKSNNLYYMNYTFLGCQTLNKVDIDCNNLYLLNYTFSNCTNLHDIKINCNSNTIMNCTFYNCINLSNMPQIPENISSMYNVFFNCTNLVNTTSISNKMVNMNYTFRNCINLVNAPDMSNATNVINMVGIFSNCTNLSEPPVISSNIINMSYAFYNCQNLKNIPTLPDTINSMSYTFYNCQFINNISTVPSNIVNINGIFKNCTNLVNAPDMSNCNNIINISEAFDGCTNLTGDIIIGSNTITNANSCFSNTSLDKNVYIPFYYENGQHTQSYNAFNTFGYSDIYRMHGVTLFDKDIQNKLSEWTYYENTNGVTSLYNYIGTSENVSMPLYRTELSEYTPTSTLFYNNQNIKSVILGDINVKNNNLSYAFYNCSNLESINNINKNISNFSHTFESCNNLYGNIIIPCENIINISNCFDNTSMNKNVYIPFDVINGIRTQTYNTFISDGYSTSTSKNGVLLQDYWQEEIRTKWYYSNSGSNKLLTRYYNTESSTDVIVPPSYTILNSSNRYYQTPFNSSNITSVDLRYVPFLNNTMFRTFEYCYNLKSVTNINQNVINMSNAFVECYNLKNIISIPNNVINMSGTFYNCWSLVNAPEISNSVTNIYQIFYNCWNLINTPDMSNLYALTSMEYAFCNCHNLVNTSVIPNNVTSMYRTFYNCQKLSGDIFILSPNVNNIGDVFWNSYLNKTIYFPYEYENGVYTQTYNVFTSNQYSETVRKNGILISNLGAKVTFNITPSNDTSIYLNKKLLNSITTYSKPGINDYILQNNNYPLYVSKFNVTDLTQNITIIKDITSITGYTITLNVDQTGCDVEFDINGVKIPATVNGNNYSITLNTDEEISIGYVVKKSGYRKVSNTVTFNNSNITENITMEETSVIEYDFQYPFNDVSELSELVDDYNFIVNTNLQAITSGPSSYNVNGGISYGYITFTTESDCELLINGYVSSESGCDFGGVYVGKQKQTPTSGQINNGTIFSDNGQWLFHYSGNGSSSDYTMQLDANTTYVLTFAYAKDGSANNGQDRLIINRIKFEAIN